MSATALAAAPGDVQQPLAATEKSVEDGCPECLGSGGWYRYEPALEPAPGMLYLACLQCRGSGRTALVRA
jgi:hypothetical protein